MTHPADLILSGRGLRLKPRRKYLNRPKLGFASKKEARRSQELELLVKAGEISHLERQVKFELIPKQEGERAVSYVADFVYRMGKARIVEDTKSESTRKNREYVIKRKLMLYHRNIRILET